MLRKEYFTDSNDKFLCVHSQNETRYKALCDVNDAYFEVTFSLEAPIKNTYIMIPACCYNGNRFKAVHRKYAPMFLEDEFGLDIPTTMTEVPRLSPKGDSFMDVTTGDMAVPCVCVFNKELCQGFMIFFNQENKGLNNGITLEQGGDILKIKITAPAKRRLVYRWIDMYPSLYEIPQADAPLNISADDEIVIKHQIFSFECNSIKELYSHFFEKRSLLYSGEDYAKLPFSAFFDMTEKQLNAEHFHKAGFYTLNAMDERNTSLFGQWQPGWCGGGINSLPMLCSGNKESIEGAISTMKFAARYQSDKGMFYAVVHNGKVINDSYRYHGEKYPMILMRKHADLTYFMFKHIFAMKNMGIEIPNEILKSAVKAADVIKEIWKKNGQLGQFINAETGEIIVGGSTSGGIASAALCAAFEFTGEEHYIIAAREIAEYYYDNFILKGFTTGGPGEAMQAPDSESIAGLFESFMALYEKDGSKKWIEYAKDTAHQISSWVVAYDYKFPNGSRLDRMKVKSKGSVWANVQNKHAAPGICTHSAAALLKLYRVTGDKRYLDLMQEIAHFMPQMTSTAENPIIAQNGKALKPGEMCERVNLSDWEGNENVGDSIREANSWTQISLMLTWLEVPGIYVFPERGILCVSDHIKARLEDGKLIIKNPTQYDARVKVMIDTEQTVKENLGFYWQNKFKIIEVKKNEQKEIAIGGL